jgi:hypothetical protein
VRTGRLGGWCQTVFCPQVARKRGVFGYRKFSLRRSDTPCLGLAWQVDPSILRRVATTGSLPAQQNLLCGAWGQQIGQ